MKLVFFDIDGTLISCGKIGRKSLEEAIISVYGCDGIPQNYSLSGKTDKQIIFEVLINYKYSLSEIERSLNSVLDDYYYILKKNIMLNGFDKKIMPGIKPLLDNLSAMNDQVILGLVTGNLKQTSYLKLAMFDLNKYFLKDNDLFGGFGSDDMSRSKIVDIAVDRAKKLYGYSFFEKDIVIIGDTNHDILCGEHLNVKSIAVCTGEWSFSELKKIQPDYLFNDFSDYNLVIESILS